MFSNLSLRQKLVYGFVLSAVIPFIAISIIAERLADQSLKESNMAILEAANQAKSHELSAYFSTIEKQIVTTASNPVTQDAVNLFDQTFAEQAYAMEGLSQNRVAVENYWRNQFGQEYANQNKRSFDVSAYFAGLSDLAVKMQADYIANNESPLGEKFKQLRSKQNSSYDEIHATYHPWFNQFLNDFGYYDIFLVNNQGVIVYSVFKELDYATSLETGPWKETGIANAYRASKQLKPGQIYWDDLKLYAPSYDAPAGFISTPIANAEGQVLGHLIFQMPLDNISEMVASRAGLGETGETYLVGPDRYMRSDSSLDEQNFSVVASFRNGKAGQLNTEAVEAALNGEKGSVITTNYLGDSVVSSYESVMLGNARWAVISDKSTDEAFAAIQSMVWTMVILGAIAFILIGFMGMRSGAKIANPIIEVANAMSKTRSSGEFDQRVSVKTGDEVEEMADSFNDLMGRLQRSVEETNRVLGAIAEGDFSQRSALKVNGDLASMQEGVNQSAESVDMTIQALDEVMSGLAEGNFSVRMSDQVSASVRRRVNGAIVAIDEAMTEVGQVMAKVAQGEFDARVESDLKGDLNELKSNVNDSLDTLQSAIEEISDNVELLSEGDLTARIEQSMRGELNVLKEKFNHALDNLSSTMTDVVDAANGVSHSAAQVAQGSMDLSQRTQEQAATLEETSASMEQMTATVSQNTDSAQTANQLSAQAREEASNGAEVVSQTVQAMEAITEASQKISDIITLIDGIAFQTNLLALNAAVEAARAGDHGRGFAVVAGEVRALAGKSADAAKDIKALIEDTTVRVEEGSRYANASGEALEVINNSIKKVSDIVSEISAASKEQQAGIEQVNKAVTGMDQVTQENAALVEETSAAAGQMNEIADQLRNQVNHFKLSKSSAIKRSTAPKVDAKPKAETAPATKVQEKSAPAPKKVQESDEWAEF